MTQKLKSCLDKLAQSLIDENHEALYLAQEINDKALMAVAEALTRAHFEINKIAEVVGNLPTSSELTLENLEEMAILATEFDKSGDPLLQKQASVLDEILLTIGASKNQVAQAKKAQDLEVSKIKAKQAEKEEFDPYRRAKLEHDKQNRVEEAKKDIQNKVKEYRPNEAALQTRTCPDHPGAQMARTGENMFQCSLDKKVYNYQSGYTTMKGNRVPGGDVANQTQSLNNIPNEFTSFDNRESKLNS